MNTTPDDLSRFEPVLRQRGTQLRQEIRDTLLRVDADRYALLADQVRDSKDLSTAERLAETGSADVQRDLHELADVENALGRLESGRYGLCTDCGADIPVARLEAYPTAKRCRPCQEKHEQRRGA